MSQLKERYGAITRKSNARPITRFMTIDGTIAGSNETNVNGSVTPVDFWIQPEPGEAFVLEYLSLSITDGGTPAFDDYGSIVGPLANGVQFFSETEAVRTELGEPFKSNNEYAVRSSEPYNIIEFAANTRLITYRDIYTELSNGILLVGDNNDKIGIIIQDDLTTLIRHQAVIKGTAFTWSA